MPVVRDYLRHQRSQGMKPLSVNTSVSSPSPRRVKDTPISPIMARKIYVVSQTPFAAETEDEVKLGINDTAEDHKFTSYHLDYKYTPPIHKMVTACEKMYCPGCFLCTNCGVELRPAYYKAHDESPYCRNCHSELFLPPCHQCGDYLGEHYLKVGDKYFHKPCFTCCKCKRPLDPKRYFERNGKLYCEDDYNNLFKPKCTKCFKPIVDDPINAGGRIYHRHCLSCHECRKNLNPNNFMERNGNLYCPECYHDLYSPKCVACKRPIITGDPIVAGGKPYHPNCFCCHQCTKPVSPGNFKEKGSRIFCPDCYHSLYSPKCTGCKKAISSGDPVNANGKLFHPRCFNCSDCSRTLDPKTFWEKNNKLFCPDCYHRLYSPKCATCKTPIINGDPIKAMGKNFHPKCFNCEKCSRDLYPHNYMEKNSGAYCVDCFHRQFSPKCYACKQPIIGEYISALGHTWHPNHFACSSCSKSLSPQDFKEHQGKLFCPDCFRNLFTEQCETCHLAIHDKAVYAMGKYYHPDHFDCQHCRRQLHQSGFYEHERSSYCEECYLNLFAPKCRGCARPITNQVYLFALASNWHDACFRCTECKCQLDENSFYEFEGEPYCEEHYHARICPDCIKMRRAVERYLGQPEGSSSKPESVVTSRTLDLPLLRTASKKSLHEEIHRTHQFLPKSPTIPIPIGREREILDEKWVKKQEHAKEADKYRNEDFGKELVDKEISEKKEWDNLYSQQWPSSVGHEFNLEKVPYSDEHFGLPPKYYRKEENLTKSSGSYKDDPNLQFESTFKKEICESVTRY